MKKKGANIMKNEDGVERRWYKNDQGNAKSAMKQVQWRLAMIICMLSTRSEKYLAPGSATFAPLRSKNRLEMVRNSK